MKHLQEIKGRFAVRIVVPPELRGVIGRGELRRWLGRDRKIAERNAHAVIADFMEQLDSARATLAASVPTMRSAARTHYEAELLADDRERLAGDRAASDLRAWNGGHRASLLRLMIAGQLDQEEADAQLGWAVEDLIRRGLAPVDVDRRSLLKALAEAQLDALNAFIERDQGKVALSPPSSPLLSEPTPDPEQPPPSKTRRLVTGPTLAQLLKDFHQERIAGKRSLSEKTMSEHIVAVRMLEEFVGSNMAAASITKSDMIDYKRALLITPTNYRQRFPGKTIVEAIEANNGLAKPYPTLNPVTINDKWLSHISTIMNWCANNGHLPDNVARGIKVDEGKGYKEPTRIGFNKDDLARMFGDPLFERPNEFGTRQWALLVALYTGARSSSEIARIKLTDIYEEQGVWVFDLEEATKNVRSKRLVPIHAKLIELGLLGYVRGLQRKGESRLFPDWEPEDKINRWFLRTFKRQVGIGDRRKVFHSFRHTLKTALAHHGVNRDVSDLITGHKDQSVGGIYIGDASVTMVRSMKEGIDRVEFPIL